MTNPLEDPANLEASIGDNRDALEAKRIELLNHAMQLIEKLEPQVRLEYTSRPLSVKEKVSKLASRVSFGLFKQTPLEANVDYVQRSFRTTVGSIQRTPLIDANGVHELTFIQEFDHHAGIKVLRENSKKLIYQQREWPKTQPDGVQELGSSVTVDLFQPLPEALVGEIDLEEIDRWVLALRMNGDTSSDYSAE